MLLSKRSFLLIFIFGTPRGGKRTTTPLVYAPVLEPYCVCQVSPETSEEETSEDEGVGMYTNDLSEEERSEPDTVDLSEGEESDPDPNYD